MDMNQIDWRCAESGAAEGPSLDFIRAVADLLETDPDDILAELGYVGPRDANLVVAEA
jgi:hypothetical protein